MSITSNQARAARAMLELHLQTIEDKIGIKINSLSRFEKGKGKLNESSGLKLQKYYEEHGLEFIEYDGVRKKPFGSFRELTGFDGFHEFINDVYNTVKENDQSKIVVSNINEKLFNKWFGSRQSEYLNRMSKLHTLNKFSFKILIEEGDDYFLASDYAEYRWVNKQHFGSVPFYVYGDKTALILFKDKDVSIYIIHNPSVSDSFRKSFDAIWKISCTPK